MSYSNLFHLTLNKFEECNPDDYSVFQCVEQQSGSALSSSLQYHLQFQMQDECTMESMRKLPNNW
ncbi:hypothetical protein T07_8543 [Trichinella nelsoni]|uniref:Uncharacterized protein n=1 Tax=Trichinella nelsoni TaxID=6336 RepID=A0A0V0SHK8_9BILA|nr:hypothetical protein T07_8543 [Trichinella nelsoni]